MPTRPPSQSPAEGDTLLIAAQSGRALAAAARRAGLRPFVADLFGDEDTRALAEGYRRVPGRFGAWPGGRGILRALDELAELAGSKPLGVVLGSGFESAPSLMERIAGRFRLLGTDARTIARLKHPLELAILLGRLGVPHPPVSLRPIADCEDWLLKRCGGSGGGHIRPAGAGPVPAGFYLQRRVTGEPFSVAFLADGSKAQAIGVTTQWAAPSARAPYRYAGAVEPAAQPVGVLPEVEQAIGSIVAATGLRGLASADCLADGPAAWWLLEINPRPGATLDVLDRRPTPLLLRHIDACLGRLGSPEESPRDAAATEIVYARRAIPAVPSVTWPVFVTDRPLPGSRIAADAPVCTVSANGDGPAHARELLRCRVEWVRRLLGEGGNVHAAATCPPERECARGAPRR